MTHIEEIHDSIETKQRLLESIKCKSLINDACQAILKSYQNGNKTLIAGNGGSAADAQHSGRIRKQIKFLIDQAFLQLRLPLIRQF